MTSSAGSGRSSLRGKAGLWAVGDITGKGAFTHVSMYQAAIATRDILGQDGPTADYRAVPRVTFTDPEIGAVHGQVPVADLRTMIYAYPTFHRAIEAALADLASG